MAIVLATDVEDIGANGVVRILAKRGDALPASLKDKRDEYLRDGILVDSETLPENRDLRISTLSELQALAARGELTDDDFKKLGELPDVGTIPPESHMQTYADRREIVQQVSQAHAQIARDRGTGATAASDKK